MKKIQVFAIVALLFAGVDSFAQQPQRANTQAPQQRGQAGFGGMRGQRGGGRQQMKPEELAKVQADNIADWIDVSDAQKQQIYDMYLSTAKEQQTMYEEQMKIMQAIRQKQQAIQATQEEKLKAIVGEKKYEKYQKQKQAQMERMQQRMQQMRQAQQQSNNFCEQGDGQRAGGNDGGFGEGTGF